MKLEKIVQVSELQDRKPMRLKGVGYNLCLVLSEGEVFAFSNRCPHTGAMLHGSRVRHNVLTCAHHLAQFDLRSGAVLTFPVEGLDADQTGPLPLYRVEIDDGWVTVDTDSVRCAAEGLG